MKRAALLIVFVVSGFAFSQTTPNIGLNIPAPHTPGWDVLMNYNFSRLDQYLSGNLGVPAFNVINLTVTGTALTPITTHSPLALGMDMYAHDDAGSRAPYLNLFKSRGTQGTPTAVTYTGYEQDSIGGINFGGYDGSVYGKGAGIYSQASQNWTPSAHGAYLSMYATTKGVTAQHQIMQFGGPDPQNVGDDNIIAYRPLMFNGAAAANPALFPVSTPASLKVRTADNLADAPLTASVVDVSAGFRHSGAAPLGNVLRGDGTNFVNAPPPASAHFVDYQSNPILSPTGGETLTAFGNVVKVSSTYHMYYMYFNVNYMIGHATSTDGVTWTKDAANNPVLTKAGSGTWDNSNVGVPNVWVEGANWYMLYRGDGTGDANQRGGYATSSDGITWTRTPTNLCAAPANTGNGCVLDKGYVSGGSEPQEFFGVIKVGSTYYAGTDNPGGATRGSGIATSTDRITWTKDAANPFFTGGRYCQAFFKLGNYYYQMISHYLAGTTTNAEIELYRSPTMPFYVSTRTYLGVVKQQAGGDGSVGAWNSYALDTPFILTDDITRSTFALTNGDLWMYYAGTSSSVHTNFFTGLAIAAQGLQTSFETSPSLPNGGTMVGPLLLTNGAGNNGYIQLNGANGVWFNNAAAYLFWQGRSSIRSLADGDIVFKNAADNAFGKLQLGGTTSSFPAIKRNAAALNFRLADDSADAAITAADIKGLTFSTTTNCAGVGTAASPSVASCTAAPAGTVSCATNAVTTCTVNTTAVTANSQIFVQQRTDTTTGTRLSVTCNVTLSTIRPDVTAVVAGTSFSFGLTQPVTNPNCYSYHIVN